MRPFWLEQALFNDGDLAPALQGPQRADVCVHGRQQTLHCCQRISHCQGQQLDLTVPIERQLYESLYQKFSASRKLPPVSTRYWSMAGAHYDEIRATKPPVDLWLPTAALEQSNRKSLGPVSLHHGRTTFSEPGVRFSSSRQETYTGFLGVPSQSSLLPEAFPAARSEPCRSGCIVIVMRRLFMLISWR